MKTTLKQSLCLMAAAWLPFSVSATLTGPYTPDASTVILLHLNEAAGGSVTTNVGTLGGNFYSVNFTANSTPLPVVTTMLGAAGYSSFNNCEYSTASGYMLGYDANKSGAFDPDPGNGSSPDNITMSELNIGNGGQTPFTLEALIQPTSTNGNQEIICTDSDAGNRGFQFRISSSVLMFQFIYGSKALSAAIPSSATDPNVFVPGAWYHVAFTYDGTYGTLYWTRMSSSVGAAHVIGGGNPSGILALGSTDGAVVGPLVIGNRGRPTGSETFLGGIDEVRISKVCRAANQMQFFSPLVTITQNPVSQNVDYNQPVAFTVSASTTGSTLGYQWYFNSNGIAGATNTAYAISHVAAVNGGYYDCLVTNTLGYAATSSVSALVVGAANFLNHRYDFATNANDLVGTANGTLLGNAIVTNGSLVLDGTAGTYMQLPANLINGASQQALTMEFWATYGANSANCYVFSLGNTNIIGTQAQGSKYVAYSPNNSSGQTLSISPSDNTFAQSVSGGSVLDGLTRHVACVIDPPNQTLAIYTNGVLESVNTNMTVGLGNVSDAFSYIGASLFAADPALNASIDELRIYNGALSAISLKQSDDQGPNIVLASGPATFAVQPASTTAPLGQTATLTAAAVGYLPITYQWFENGAAIPGATNAAYTLVVSSADNHAVFQVFATNTIGVTTYGTGSTTATLTVVVPSTVAWADSSHGGADSVWNTTSLDWLDSGNNLVAYVQTNAVLFDDRGSGSTSVDVSQAITPYGITVNSSSDYTLYSSASAGSLNGQGWLLKQNSDTLILDVTNNLSGSTTIAAGKLQIGNGDTYGTLGSGPVTNNGTLSFDRSDTILSVPNAIHGTGTVSFDGGGATTISGTSDYTGATYLNSGIVYLTSSNGLGATSSGTVVASGAQLYLTANVDIAPEQLTLNGTGDGNGALRKGGAGATTYYGPIYLAGDSTIGVDSGATLTLSNSVTGTSALTLSGTGTLALAAPNGYTGGTVLSGTVVDVNANGALGYGAVTASANGHFVLADGVNFTNSLTASSVNPGAGLGLLMVNDNTNGTVTTISGPLEFDASSSSGGDFCGPLTSGYLNVLSPITGSGNVNSRAGLVRFSGGGTYTLFQLNAGTISLGANNGLSPSTALSIGLSAAAAFDLNGFNQTLTGVYDGQSTPAAELITNSAAAASVLTLELTSGYTFSGVIGGNVGLVVSGSGSLDLAGTNTYTGNTTVSGGTLELAQGTLAPASVVTAASGAILQLDATNINQVAALILNGVSQPAGLYNNNNASTYLTGNGGLLVVPVATNPTNIVASVSGTTLTLSWPANHTGWRLLVQTNNLAGGLSSNTNDWGTVSGSTATNAVNLTIDPAKAAEFFRMVYP